MSELTAQDIHKLFNSSTMESDTPRKVYLALFADADENDVLMFLGKLYNDLKNLDVDLDWGLDFLMMEVFRRTNAHSDAQAAYVKQLLNPKQRKPQRRKGGDA